MTTLNDTLNAAFATLNNAVANAEAKRDEAIGKAKAAFATTEDKATGTFQEALKKAADKHFDQGGTLDEFAEAYGKSAVTTRNHLKAAGVDIPAGKKGAKSKHTDAEKLEIANAWKTGDKKARAQLTIDNDVTEATMRNWAIDLGVYVPVKREAKVEAEVEATS